MEPIHILLYYRYVQLDNPARFTKEHLALCNQIGLRGRILIASEGMNGSVSGMKEQIEAYKQAVHADPRFAGMPFKEDIGVSHPFKKMVVKVKPVILNMGADVDMTNAGTHLKPEEFLHLYETGQDVVVVDARNDYEWRVGKFKNAVTLPMKTFRDFPKIALKELAPYKNKKVVMYCTGGIRCEKASAYLKENGFADVSQIEGGILTFGKAHPDTVWEGTCFVFDRRMVSNVNTENKPLTVCELCTRPCDLYRNCSHLTCDAYCVVCIDCEQTHGGCCSKACFVEMQTRNMGKERIFNVTSINTNE